MSRSSRSPASCPSVSLTNLKPSRSRHSSPNSPHVRLAQQFRQPFIQQCPVRQTGEHIVMRHVANACIGDPPLGDIGKGSHLSAARQMLARGSQ